MYIYIPCTSCLDKMFIKLHKHNKLVFLNKPEAAKVHGICLKSGQSSSLTWTLLKRFNNPSNKTEKEKYISHRSKYLSKINTNYSSVLCGKISEFHMINLWKFWYDLPQLSFAWQMIKNVCLFWFNSMVRECTLTNIKITCNCPWQLPTSKTYTVARAVCPVLCYINRLSDCLPNSFLNENSFSLLSKHIIHDNMLLSELFVFQINFYFS